MSIRLTGLILALLCCPAFSFGQQESSGQSESQSQIQPRFDAPSLDGGIAWLNVEEPLDWKQLRGKVVLLDFWTYCCINCMHVLPDLKYLEQKYADQLVVIGVHSAKFENEKETSAIRDAVQRYEIEHAVVNDAEMTIWRKFGIRSWPSLVVVDPEGKYIGYVSGEGNRELLDEVVSKLISQHREKGTLKEGPFELSLEAEKAEKSALRYPGKLLVDEPSNRLFISDTGHNRILICSLDGQLQQTIGTGAIGAADGNYQTAQFDHPQGLCLIKNVLYVADTENHLIRIINLETKQVATLAGTGKQASFRAPGGALKQTALNSPWDLVELNGTIYIAMAGPHQLWQHKLGSDLVEVFAGNGRENVTDGPAMQATLAQPSGLTTDGENLYFVDSEGSAVRIVEFDPEPSLRTLVGPHDLPGGRALFEFADIDGIGDDARLQHPIGLTFSQGKLFVTDSYNHKIKLIDPQTRESKTWKGSGTAGTELSVEAIQFSEPAGISLSSQNVYIADTNNHRIVVINQQTGDASELPLTGLQAP